ncbi:Xaa-Pro aminopeptidase [Fontibacillus phaseoli]|uniref:Xaa-Pro aminopeptidase n=1 Tax=Fontibacillus phaseoli TaxID=1416533 RepID=A0A369BG71_9BACL|nr:M24 family metallopeptidase [Fontibacillus phaseoli]RCX20550.1 Xaa-Pro aminopeptidase [Fontibacillus phaseoli]
MNLKDNHLLNVADRAKDLLEREGLDALIASSAENVYYLSGQPSVFMYTFRMSEAAFAVVFRDPGRNSILIMSEFEASGLPEVIPGFDIVTYPQWIDLDDPFGMRKDLFTGERPDAPRPDAALAALAETLPASGLTAGAVVAAELGGMRGGTRALLAERLPLLRWAEAAPLFTALRARKTGFEIAQLRESCAISEEALSAAVQDIAAGVTAAELAAAFRIAATRRCFGFSERFATISVGPQFAPASVYSPHRAAPGDIIKFDVGADVQGYGADIARTFALGEPGDAAKRAYAALRPGHDRMLELVGPGVPMAAVFAEGMQVIRRSGLPDYNRGHLGHSIGLALATEEAPFFSAADTTVLEPNMVVCIETPYYGYGVGSVMIEDMLLITENGNERLNKLTRDLVVL